MQQFHKLQHKEKLHLFSSNFKIRNSCIVGKNSIGMNAFNQFSIQALMVAVAKYFKEAKVNQSKPVSVILFHNGNDENKLFCEHTINVLSNEGIHIILNEGHKSSNSGLCSYLMHRGIADYAIIFNSDRFDNYTYCEIFQKGGVRIDKKILASIIQEIHWDEKIFTTNFKRKDDFTKFISPFWEKEFLNEIKYFQTFSTIPHNMKIIINIDDRNNYELVKKIFNELGYFTTNFMDIPGVNLESNINYKNVDQLLSDLSKDESIKLNEFSLMLFLDNNLKYAKLVFKDFNDEWVLLKDFELYYALVKFQILSNKLANPTNSLDNIPCVCYTSLSPTIHQYKNDNKFENISLTNVGILLNYIKTTKKEVLLIFDEDGLLYTENNFLNYNSGIINFIKIVDMWNYYNHLNKNILEVSKIDYISNHFYNYIHLDKHIYDDKSINDIIKYLKNENLNSVASIPVFKKELILNNEEYFIIKFFLSKKDTFNYCGFKIHKPTYKISTYYSILAKNKEMLKNTEIFLIQEIENFIAKYITL